MTLDFLADMFGLDDADWMQHPKRNCAKGNPDRFFPRKAVIDDAYAAALCHGCPVVNKCGAYAIPQPELDGIWGGLTADARKTLRRSGEAA